MVTGLSICGKKKKRHFSYFIHTNIPYSSKKNTKLYTLFYYENY